VTTENGDKVTRVGCFVTVQICGIKATKQYGDGWQAKRAERGLRESVTTRQNFFRPIRRSR
jgi:hypothetical protein